MLDVAVNEPPNNEEAITYTVVDSEIDHEDTSLDNGIIKNFSPQVKPCEDALNPQKSRS